MLLKLIILLLSCHFLLCHSSSSSSCSLEDESQKPPCKEVNSTYFKDPDFTNKKVAVLFYATWCGYCKPVKEKWKNLCKSNDLCGTELVMCNCAFRENNEICHELASEGYPEIMTCPKNKSYKEGIYYNGDRSESSIKNHIKNTCCTNDEST